MPNFLPKRDVIFAFIKTAINDKLKLLSNDKASALSIVDFATRIAHYQE